MEINGTDLHSEDRRNYLLVEREQSDCEKSYVKDNYIIPPVIEFIHLLLQKSRRVVEVKDLHTHSTTC